MTLLNIFSKNFLNIKFQNSLYKGGVVTTILSKNNNIRYNFNFKNQSIFSNFFILNNIDIPKCFSKTKSLKRSLGQINLLKFNNFFFKNGLRYKFYRILITVLGDLFFKNSKITHLVYWKSFFLLYSNLFYKSTYYSLKSKLYKNNLIDQGVFSKNITLKLFIKNIIFLNFKKLSPVFIFFIYKLNKFIYKNTRGKIGKYIFI